MRTYLNSFFSPCMSTRQRHPTVKKKIGSPCCSAFFIFHFLSPMNILTQTRLKLNLWVPPGVDFIKVGGKARIIEIGLSICTLCLRPTFEKPITGANVGHRARKMGPGCKTVYKIDPWTFKYLLLGTSAICYITSFHLRS